jgi:hypothetical protein
MSESQSLRHEQGRCHSLHSGAPERKLGPEGVGGNDTPRRSLMQAEFARVMNVNDGVGPPKTAFSSSVLRRSTRIRLLRPFLPSEDC